MPLVGEAGCTWPGPSGIIAAMNALHRRRRFAALLKRSPGLIRVLYPLYQVTRPRFSMGVIGIVFDTFGRVLLAEHVFHPIVPWGIPGGGVGSGEDPADAVKREYFEELGMTISVVQPVLIEKTYFRHIDVAFMCVSTDPPIVSTSELLDAQWFPRENLPPITKFQYRALMNAYDIAERQPRLMHD